MTVFWVDRLGAHRMACFGSVEKCQAFLSKLRCEARVEDDQKNVIGGVEYRPGLADDRRIKWFWWLEVA